MWFNLFTRKLIVHIGRNIFMLSCLIYDGSDTRWWFFTQKADRVYKCKHKKTKDKLFTTLYLNTRFPFLYKLHYMLLSSNRCLLKSCKILLIKILLSSAYMMHDTNIYNVRIIFKRHTLINLPTKKGNLMKNPIKLASILRWSTITRVLRWSFEKGTILSCYTNFNLEYSVPTPPDIMYVHTPSVRIVSA